ncbi:MAG: T9SS C-terminal target domain-containing protein [Flavobacteriia bacterium]|nr:T9SS C-terminal target domain-containing protein [Flavobacteriia bacterium]
MSNLLKFYLVAIIVLLCNVILSQNHIDSVYCITGASNPSNGIWTVPQNAQSITVKCWGGGGAGGYATGQACAGGGGGGGSFVQKTFIVTPGQQFSYSVGNGGIGALNSTMLSGANTWFGSTSTLLARGGLGGNPTTMACCMTASGAPAVSTGNVGGDLSFYGGGGGTGTNGGNGSMAGGGGGSASQNSNGNAGQGLVGGLGAGNGAYSQGVGCNCNGSNGQLPGGGGSGGQASGVIDKSGGNGGSGLIVIEYTIPGIGGQVFGDLNSNCINDNETGVNQIIVQVTPGNYTTMTDNNGFWHISNIPNGNYMVIYTTMFESNQWCNDTVLVNNYNSSTFYEVNNGYQSIVSCTQPQVTVFIQSMRRCFGNQKIKINVKNKGTATQTIFSPNLVVTLHPYFQVDNSTANFTYLGNGKYNFQLADFTPGEDTTITLSTTVSCNAMIFQTLCVKAELYPSISCSPNYNQQGPINVNGVPYFLTSNPYDNSNLVTSAICTQDSAELNITNQSIVSGNAMTNWLPVFIYKNATLFLFDSVLLADGGNKTYRFLSNGETWTIKTLQHPLNPIQSQSSSFIEACPSGINWVPNYPLQIQSQSSYGLSDEACGITSGSFDPNDKTGYPIGIGNSHNITSGQQIDYCIRFQNTGNDTAFTVVILDTIDQNMNIGTFQNLCTSHESTFEILNGRVARWTFNDIQLPDSTTNEELSHGWIKFRINQNSNLLNGEQIRNKSYIYFDFNEPIITNEVFHTINNNFEIQENNLEEHLFQFTLYPNPTSSEITITSDKFTNEPYTLFDQMGRAVGSGTLAGTNTTISLSNLSKGIYILKVEGAYESAIVVKE